MATEQLTSSPVSPALGQEHSSLITEEQLRVALNLPNIYAVRDLRQKRKIPCVRLGYRTIRYSLPRVLKALEKLEQKEASAAR